MTKKRGRPSSFTQDVADAICERIAGGESMRRICSDEGMPDRATVLRWLDADESFAAKYARAREHQGDYLDDEMAEVVDEVRSGALDPQAGRVVLAGMQWRASKLAPKKYGDRLDLNANHSGGVQVTIVSEFQG